MERDDLATVAGFFLDTAPFAPGATVALGEDAAHHARVRRLEIGDRVFIADGRGARAMGRLTSLTKKDVEASIEEVRRFAPQPSADLLVPVADRDRMLWCAEKCAELGATTWTPVIWNRSKSVSPRGEGASFQDKVRARMKSALVQSHGVWLPEVRAESALERAIQIAPPNATRLVLDVSGDAISRVEIIAPVTIAVGPEGGIEDAELSLLRDARFRPVSLGANVLRFETAAIAALAIVRAALAASPENAHG